MRLWLCLALVGCGTPVTAPKATGCTYVQAVTQNGTTIQFTHYLPADHPLCLPVPLHSTTP